jgi:regulatory protein
MTITVYNIRAVSDGAEAEISLELRSGEQTQEIKGIVSAAMLGEMGFGSRLGTIFEIDRPTCDLVLRYMKLHSAIKKGIALLGFSRNTKKALKNKLTQRGYPADIAEEAASYLASHGYISEHTDAELLAQTLAERKLYGKNRIRKELYAKGFEAEAIRDAMETLDVDFAEICAKRVKNMGGIPVFEEKETKSKAMASLMRYGFSYDDVREALDILKGE